jgi:riboflavin synthase
MFTGLVEETGAVVSLENSRLRVRTHLVPCEGDSVAVNGCCLTAVEIADGMLGFDLLGETLRRTNLGDLGPGSVVNLERALAADGRLGGHFVQGHIDGTSEVLSFEQRGNDYRLEIALPGEFAGLVVEKGSICLDGISLTIAEVSAKSFAVWIIPHTLAVTNLRGRKQGERVNVEYDLLAKHVARLIEARMGV